MLGDSSMSGEGSSVNEMRGLLLQTPAAGAPSQYETTPQIAWLGACSGQKTLENEAELECRYVKHAHYVGHCLVTEINILECYGTVRH